MTDPHTKRSRGFGFVTFQDHCSVLEVLKRRPHVLDNKVIDPKAAVPRGPFQSAVLSRMNGLSSIYNGRSLKIFVGGIGQATEEDLKMYFNIFGKVTDVTIMIDKMTGRPRGFAFVGFESAEAVERTSRIQYHTIRGKMVEVKKAQPRESNQRIHPQVPGRIGRPPNNGGGPRIGSPTFSTSSKHPYDFRKYVIQENMGSFDSGYGSDPSNAYLAEYNCTAEDLLAESMQGLGLSDMAPLPDHMFHSIYDLFADLRRTAQRTC